MANSDFHDCEALHMRRDGDEACYLDFSVWRVGNFITAGRTSRVSVRIEDGPDIRSLTGYLFQLKANNFDGVVDVTFNEDQYYIMDQSLWRELADGLFAFTLSVDCAKLGI